MDFSRKANQSNREMKDWTNDELLDTWGKIHTLMGSKDIKSVYRIGGKTHTAKLATELYKRGLIDEIPEEMEL